MSDRPRYAFTIDDNIRFLEELHRTNAPSLFDSSYMAVLRRMHERFACKIQLNMFYSYAPGSFSLSDCTERYRREFAANADWLKLSFHGRHSAPPFPYEGKDEELLRDFDQVMYELRRIAGEEALGRTTTIHYVTCGETACRGLRERGVEALIGMFYDLPGVDALRNCLTREEARPLLERSFFFHAPTGMRMARNDMVMNRYPLEEIVPLLEAVKARPNPDRFYEIMIHEQYFYPDYGGYQPDFAQKLEAALSWMEKNGCESVFLEEVI